MCSLARGSRLSRGSLRGTGSGTDTCALRGTGLPTHQPSAHKCLRQQPGPGVSAEPQFQSCYPQGEVKDRPRPSPQERAEGRASALRPGPATAHNKPDRQTDRKRHTHTHRDRGTQTGRSRALSPRPPPSRTGAGARPPRRLQTSRAFPGGRARAHGRRAAAPRPRLPGPVPLVGGRPAPGRAADLGARGCCTCAEAAAAPAFLAAFP